jgi:tetratricopeptide (TPR) repeat protein
MLHSEHTGNGEAAERYAALAMASSPGDARALTAHAACLERRGDADAAEEAHRQAVKSPGAGPLSFSRFAAFMERRGMKEVALELYREALQQDEGDVDTAYRCGRLLASMNDAESRSEAVGLIRMAAEQVMCLAKNPVLYRNRRRLLPHGANWWKHSRGTTRLKTPSLWPDC